jgi:hypothetical protein
MSLKDHFRFNVADAKQLSIALMSSYAMWAATGFQKDIAHLAYPIVGFITGGLASHNSSNSPNVMADSHIQTPYVNNIDDKSNDVPTIVNPDLGVYKPEGADVKKIIKINSGIIK